MYNVQGTVLGRKDYTNILFTIKYENSPPRGLQFHHYTHSCRTELQLIIRKLQSTTQYEMHWREKAAYSYNKSQNDSQLLYSNNGIQSTVK